MKLFHKNLINTERAHNTALLVRVFDNKAHHSDSLKLAGALYRQLMRIMILIASIALILFGGSITIFNGPEKKISIRLFKKSIAVVLFKFPSQKVSCLCHWYECNGEYEIDCGDSNYTLTPNDQGTLIIGESIKEVAFRNSFMFQF